MASDLLSSVLGGSGGLFVAESAGIGGVITAGATTNALVVTPPAGQRVFLYFLNNKASSSPNSAMDILFGSRKVIDNLILNSRGESTASFNIGGNIDYVFSSAQTASLLLPNLIGKTGETMTLNFLSASTIDVNFTYQLGE